MQSKISIVIPSYNRESIISETLDSVKNQTYTNWECILVDDSSTDKTLIVIDNYIRKDDRFYAYKKPIGRLPGPSSSRNYALEKASGDYVIFLDSDDLLSPYCLENRIKALKNHEECDFLVFQMDVFKTGVPDYNVSRQQNVLENKEYLKGFINLYSLWKVTGPIYRLDYIKMLKGFNESLTIYEDLELAIRSITNSSCFKVFKEVDCYYRNNEDYFKKQVDIDFITKIVDSFEQYCYAFHENTVLKFPKNDDLKNSLINNYKRIFTTYIVQSTPKFFKQNRSILKFMNENGYLSILDKTKFYAVKNVFLKFHKFKGYGLFRLVNFLMK